MFSEQALMNAGVLIVAASAGGTNITGGLTGFVFNIMLIVRAPLQLFQAIQTSILPHLAGLEARESADEFRHAINVTVLAIAAFGLAVALGLLLIGPEVMKIFFSSKAGQYNRFGLALVGLGMGLHLISGTLNQAALARGRDGDGRGLLVDGGGAVRRLPAGRHRRLAGLARGGRLLRRDRRAVCAALAALPPRERRGCGFGRPCPPGATAPSRRHRDEMAP